jgi:hypothetical protein
LFGEDALDTYGTFEGEKFEDVTGWRKGFDTVCVTVDSINAPEKWRIILDTPEKVKWFEPQVFDKVEAFVWSNDALICVSGVFKSDAPEKGHFDLVSGGQYFTSKKLHRITERNGQPFPVPQDVKLGETV